MPEPEAPQVARTTSAGWRPVGAGVDASGVGVGSCSTGLVVPLALGVVDAEPSGDAPSDGPCPAESTLTMMMTAAIAVAATKAATTESVTQARLDMLTDYVAVR